MQHRWFSFITFFCHWWDLNLRKRQSDNIKQTTEKIMKVFFETLSFVNIFLSKLRKEQLFHMNYEQLCYVLWNRTDLNLNWRETLLVPVAIREILSALWTARTNQKTKVFNKPIFCLVFYASLFLSRLMFIAAQ